MVLGVAAGAAGGSCRRVPGGTCLPQRCPWFCPGLDVPAVETFLRCTHARAHIYVLLQVLRAWCTGGDCRCSCFRGPFSAPLRCGCAPAWGSRPRLARAALAFALALWQKPLLRRSLPRGSPGRGTTGRRQGREVPRLSLWGERGGVPPPSAAGLLLERLWEPAALLFCPKHQNLTVGWPRWWPRWGRLLWYRLQGKTGRGEPLSLAPSAVLAAGVAAPMEPEQRRGQQQGSLPGAWPVLHAHRCPRGTACGDGERQHRRIPGGKNGLLLKIPQRCSLLDLRGSENARGWGQLLPCWRVT